VRLKRSDQAASTQADRAEIIQKVWLELHREGTTAAQCRVEWLMRDPGPAESTPGLQGPHHHARQGWNRAGDLLNRDFTAPVPTPAGSPTSPTWRHGLTSSTSHFCGI